MEDKLMPLLETTLNGRAEVEAVFDGGNQGKVAGCVVLDGRIVVGDTCVLCREKKRMHEGKLKSLRRIKSQVKEVVAGKECGIDLDGFKDWEVGDVIECYGTSSRKQT